MINCSRCQANAEILYEIDGMTTCDECMLPHERERLGKVAQYLAVGNTITSFLGQEPICDICRKHIVEGDKVEQNFTGKVAIDNESKELGIEESTYYLIHISCKQEN